MSSYMYLQLMYFYSIFMEGVKFYQKKTSSSKLTFSCRYLKLLRLYGSYTNLPSVDDYHIKKMGFKGLTSRVLNSNRKYTGSVSIFIQICPFFSYNHPGTVNLQCVERHFVTNYLVVLRQFVTTYSCGVQSVCDNLLI